ncbi:heme biosynthesis protein [Sphaerotilus microaerophilus]|uniref:siroheme decarboxylase n=2 Tax=Sphaerotilus microaerophilus TaxID=2914710 RepID=A0ABN6PWY2_9BURK|nr:heme biosynthesis protein [Sphaerotilus sp. FB-5]
MHMAEVSQVRTTAHLADMDLRLLERLHGELPLSDRPFAEVAVELGLREDALIDRLRQLLSSGVLTRFGPLFQIERAGGRFVLAAIAVPPERWDAVVAQVNAHAEVAHNYRREHALNMWFVVATESLAQADAVLAAIQAETGLEVLAFPKEREYFVELRLPLRGSPLDARPDAAPPVARRPAAPQAMATLDGFDRALIAATQGGLPLVPRPYEAVGAVLGVSAEQVRERLAEMLAQGLIRRIGAVPNHYRLGYIANGMTVWDVDDAHIDALGERIGALPGVSHCYRRPRHLPSWPYNLFAMLHGRSRAEVEQQAAQLRTLLGDACRASDILYSSEILKKTGLRLGHVG